MFSLLLGISVFQVTVTTRIIPFLVGNPYKPSFATVTGWGVDPDNTVVSIVQFRCFTVFESFLQRSRRVLKGSEHAMAGPEGWSVPSVVPR